MLLMSLRGRLHADAGVRTGIVVEGNEGGYALQCVLVRLEALLAVDDLRLEYAVHTLCYGVVSGLVVLRHANVDAILPEFVRIGVTALLYASVRVVDEPLQLISRSLRDGHPESLQRVLCLQRLRQAPAHDLVRVGVRHQIQIAAVNSQRSLNENLPYMIMWKPQ